MNATEDVLNMQVVRCNDLPNNVQNAPSVKVFKYGYKEQSLKSQILLKTDFVLCYCVWSISFKFVILCVLYILYIITQDIIEKQPC